MRIENVVGLYMAIGLLWAVFCQAQQDRIRALEPTVTIATFFVNTVFWPFSMIAATQRVSQ